MDKRFFGVWSFDPDGSDYGEATPPRSAVYTMLPDEEGIWFHVRWTDDERRYEIAFRGEPGRSLALPGEADAQLATRFDESGLVTEVMAGQTVLQFAHRRLDSDDRMVVVQRDDEVETRAVYHRAPVKQVMVYRRDLAMRKGKIAAQCAHASMAVFFQRDEGPVDRLSVRLDGPMAAWAKGRFAKVVLSVEGEAELMQIHAEASQRGVPCALITDSGKTEFHGQPTRTTVALGPAPSSEIDAITGRDGLVPTKLA